MVEKSSLFHRKKEAEKERVYLVPISDSEESFSTLDFACDLARMTHARVRSIYVIEVPRDKALDSEMLEEEERGELVLAKAQQLMKNKGLNIHSDEAILSQARLAWQAILEEAEAIAADSIIVGAKGRRGLSKGSGVELEFTSRQILSHARCQVILSRQAGSI